MHCIIKYNVQGKQARVKNANLRHPSVLNVLRTALLPDHNLLLKSSFMAHDASRVSLLCGTSSPNKYRTQGTAMCFSMMFSCYLLI